MLDTKFKRSTLRQNQSQTAEHIASEKGDGLFTETFPTPNYQGRGMRQGSKEALQRDPTLTLSPPQLSHITQPSTPGKYPQTQSNRLLVRRCVALNVTHRSPLWQWEGPKSALKLARSGIDMYLRLCEQLMRQFSHFWGILSKPFVGVFSPNSFLGVISLNPL